MKKIVSAIFIFAAIVFGTFNASAQKNAAAPEPKAVVAPDKMQQTKNTATDASTASERAKSNSAAATVSKPEAGKTIPRPETLRKMPVVAPVMKELNPQKEADIKPTPKIAPLPSQG